MGNRGHVTCRMTELVVAECGVESSNEFRRTTFGPLRMGAEGHTVEFEDIYLGF